MKDIIRIMKGLRYDVVIFDASSLNFSESAFMTTHTDGTLLVIGFDVTKRETAKHAKKVMEKVKAKLLGVIVNSR
jgi:Mrp family chromosome partitioning ATPase